MNSSIAGVAHLAGTIVVVLAIVGLTACGDVGHERDVVRVAGSTINKSTLDHWAAAFARGATPATSVRSPNKSPQKQAIAFLISADWLVAEAAEHGFKLSKSQIERRAQAERESAAGGGTEFQRTLAAVGETAADAGFEEHARWAASAVHGLLAAEAAKMTRGAVTDSEVVDYYRAHVARYRHDEVRRFNIIENFKDEAAARAFLRRMGSRPGRSGFALEESYMRPSRFDAPHGRGPLLRAIFSARVGVASRPMRLFQYYAVFVVRQIKPLVVESLSAVRGAIAAHLSAIARRRALAGLLAGYDRKWTVRTDCAPGYVVQKCKQYQGPLTSEDEALLSGGGASS